MNTSIARHLALTATLASPLLSCSFLVETDTVTCNVTADCAAKGGAFTGSVCMNGTCQAEAVDPAIAAMPEAWRCLRTPPPSGGDNVKLRFEVTDPSNPSAENAAGSPVVGITVRACGRIDFTCSRPVATQLTDEKGKATLEVPSGFAGYYEVFGNSSFVPVLMSIPETYSDRLMPTSLAASALVDAIYESVSVPRDENAALVLLQASNCASGPGPDVRFELEGRPTSERLIYALGGVPDETASKTDTSGTAYLFNARPGQLAVRSSVATTGLILMSGGAQVRAGWLTVVALYPVMATPLASP